MKTYKQNQDARAKEFLACLGNGSGSEWSAYAQDTLEEVSEDENE